MSRFSPRATGAPGRAAFAFIFVTVALDMLALGVSVPVLPKLIIQFEGGDIASAATVAGTFGTAWAAMQLIFQPVVGMASDRFGRRPIVLLSNFGLGADYLFMALAPTLPWLFVGRLLSGITAASFSTATAYIADVTPQEGRARAFGMLGAAFGLGFIVGPAVGGALGAIDLRLPFWVAGGLSLLNALYGFFILPESLPPEKRSPFRWKKANPIGSLTLLRSNRVLVGLALASFCSFLAHESLPSMFVLYADHRYGWDAGTVGYALAAVGICSTIVSAVLVGASVKRLGEKKTALAGLVFGATGFFSFGMAWNGMVFLAAQPLVALWGLAGPAMTSLMSARVDPTEQGQLQGALGSLRGVTGVLGPVLFTQTFAASIAGSWSIPGAPYYLAAVMLVAALALVGRASPHARQATARGG